MKSTLSIALVVCSNTKRAIGGTSFEYFRSK
jgi:hypothetical protein